MKAISAQHKATIRALVNADPEVAQTTCDIPHLDPTNYIREGRPGEALPHCGCFVGVYAWMQECKRGLVIPPYWDIPRTVAGRTGCSDLDVVDFAYWCSTPAKDRLAVRYARGLLEEHDQW